MKKPKSYEVKVSNDGAGYPPKMPSHEAVKKAGHEVKENPPAILAKTAKKKGKKAARKQKIAIMLSKARKGA